MQHNHYSNCLVTYYCLGGLFTIIETDLHIEVWLLCKSDADFQKLHWIFEKVVWHQSSTQQLGSVAYRKLFEYGTQYARVLPQSNILKHPYKFLRLKLGKLRYWPSLMKLSEGVQGKWAANRVTRLLLLQLSFVTIDYLKNRIAIPSHSAAPAFSLFEFKRDKCECLVRHILPWPWSSFEPFPASLISG